MNKFFGAIAAAVLMVAASNPVVAQTVQKEHVVVVDNSNVCGGSRRAAHIQQDNIQFAERVMERKKAEGYKVRMVVINPGQNAGMFSQSSTIAQGVPIYINNGC